MRVVICSDKWKGSLTAAEACAAMAAGVRAAHPTATIIQQPLADGGEGSLEVIRASRALTEHRMEVTGPLRRPVQASYLLGEGIAYIESARACGLQHVPKHRRDPGYTTTIGVGQLIEDALARGAERIHLFLGGSATNDGGVGMAAALGYRFISNKGHDFVPSGDSLSYVAHIDSSGVSTALNNAVIKVICDVDNSLLGLDGATYAYSRQKGASLEQMALLEHHMTDLVETMDRDLSDQILEIPSPGTFLSRQAGAGAAGGLGFGAAAFLGGQLVDGFAWLAEEVGLLETLRGADLVLTGEGKIDGQTLRGKVVAGVGRLAKLVGAPVWGFCGVNELKGGTLPAGVSRAYSLLEMPGVTEDLATRLATELLTERVKMTV